MRSGVDAPPAVPSGAAPDSAARSGMLVGQTTLVASEPTNALVIRTAPPNFPLLRETIQALDVRPAQVLFEVTVAEVTLGRGDEYGIDWHEVGGSVESTFGNPLVADTTVASGLVMRLLSIRNADIRALLRAIASRSNVRVLSTPEVLATNNREARVLVGSRVPFVASTRLGTTWPSIAACSTRTWARSYADPHDQRRQLRDRADPRSEQPDQPHRGRRLDAR